MGFFYYILLIPDAEKRAEKIMLFLRPFQFNASIANFPCEVLSVGMQTCDDQIDGHQVEHDDGETYHSKPGRLLALPAFS